MVGWLVVLSFERLSDDAAAAGDTYQTVRVFTMACGVTMTTQLLIIDGWLCRGSVLRTQGHWELPSSVLAADEGPHSEMFGLLSFSHVACSEVPRSQSVCVLVCAHFVARVSTDTLPYANREHFGTGHS